MSITGFVLRNALRNKRRAALTILSVAVSLFLLVTLLVALRELTNPPEDSGSSLRVAVRSRVSITQTLPARQKALIENTPGVDCVTPFTWFGGKFREEENMTFAQFAIDPSKFRRLFGEGAISAAEIADFEKDRTACIIGADTMKRFNLQVGQRITIVGQLFPADLELRIAGVYSGTIDDRNLWFHHAYMDELMDNWGQVGMWWLRVTSAEAAPAAIESINRAFANSANAVRAESERAFQMSFVSMWGNIRILVSVICTAVVITLALVTASTMSMAIRERFRELAILKAIGFRRRELFAFIVAESFALALAGAVVGAGGAWLFYSNLDIAKATGGMLPFFEVTPRILAFAFAVAAGLGLVASIFPGVATARMSVVKGLRMLD